MIDSVRRHYNAVDDIVAYLQVLLRKVSSLLGYADRPSVKTLILTLILTSGYCSDRVAALATRRSLGTEITSSLASDKASNNVRVAQSGDAKKRDESGRLYCDTLRHLQLNELPTTLGTPKPEAQTQSMPFASVLLLLLGVVRHLRLWFRGGCGGGEAPFEPEAETDRPGDRIHLTLVLRS